MSRFLLLLLLLLPQRLPLNDLLDSVSRTYGRLKNFSAEFEQISQDFSNQTARQRGHVYLQSGRKARFEYVSPVQKTEYFDGQTYTSYLPAPVFQAHRMPVGKVSDDRLAVFHLVGNPESPWKDQFREWEEPRTPPLTPGDRVIRLIPRSKDLKDVLVEVDPGTFLIRRFVFTYADGERNEFRFSDIKTAPLDPSIFKFKPPPGVEVLEVR